MVAWELGLSLGSAEVGSAVRIDGSSQAHLIGGFPTLTRAVSAAAAAAPDQVPTRSVVVYPLGMDETILGEHLAEFSIAGGGVASTLPDVTVLSRMEGSRVVLIDADRNLLVSSSGTTSNFSVETLAAWVAEEPFGTAVYLVGEASIRDPFLVAARDHPPTLVERPALAALALMLPEERTLERRHWWPF